MAVYNVTTYLEEHPGGAEILKECGGTDATEAFEDVGHSERAWTAMESLIVGELSLKSAADSYQSYQESREVVTLYRPTYEHVKTAAVLTKEPATKWLVNLATKAISLGLTGVLLLKGGPRLLDQARRSRALIPAGGFWYGFLSSAAAFSIVSAGAGCYLASLLNASQIVKYPSRQKARQRTFVGQHSSLANTGILDARSYRKFPLSKKEELSRNVLRLVFALPKPSDVLNLPTGQHVSVRADIDGQSVTRSYTPISNSTDEGVIDLIVKVYEQGVLTRHLASLQVGDHLEFRGPLGPMKYRTGLCSHIGMIAGGTGITPMYQIIRAICEDASDKTTVSLLYANNVEGDIILRAQLDHWAAQCPTKFNVSYVLLHPPREWKHCTGLVTKELIREKLPITAPDSKIMLCGPPGMVSVVKRYIAELGLQTPGAISKANDQVFVF
ncbi:Cytochrome b5-like Heme/Steroid binding domain-containing protein [Cladophialophora immunda]|nr:Cytochrome b5-like Heme/Steroid binding domain-containing protein [Cladophialophora immunda]